jgi:hypothetical protein
MICTSSIILLARTSAARVDIALKRVGDRAVLLSRLESVSAWRHRGFESLPHRFPMKRVARREKLKVKLKVSSIELNLKKTLWKLAYASRAVSHVHTTCDFYLEHIRDDRHPIFIPLMCSICVTYARAFTDSGGVGMISQKFSRFSDPKLQKTHDLLWESRKRFYAHIDATATVIKPSGQKAPLQEVRVAITRTKDPEKDVLNFGLMFPEIRLRGIVVPDIRELCLELARRLHEEINTTLRRLFSSKAGELIQLLNEAKSDYIEVSIDLES